MPIHCNAYISSTLHPAALYIYIREEFKEYHVKSADELKEEFTLISYLYELRRVSPSWRVQTDWSLAPEGKTEEEEVEEMEEARRVHVSTHHTHKLYRHGVYVQIQHRYIHMRKHAYTSHTHMHTTHAHHTQAPRTSSSESIKGWSTLHVTN